MSRNSKHRTTALIFIGLLLLSACGSSEQKQGGETYSPSSPSGTETPSAFSFSFDPDNVNLGSVARYSNTSSQTVTLKNTGIQKMTCYAPYSYGPNSRDFTIVEDNCVDRPVIAGQQCTYRIRGTPSGVGKRIVQYEVNCYGDSYIDSNAFVTLTMTGL